MSGDELRRGVQTARRSVAPFHLVRGDEGQVVFQLLGRDVIGIDVRRRRGVCGRWFLFALSLSIGRGSERDDRDDQNQACRLYSIHVFSSENRFVVPPEGGTTNGGTLNALSLLFPHVATRHE